MFFRRMPYALSLLIVSTQLLSACAWWRGDPGSPQHGPGDMESRAESTTDRGQLERRVRALVEDRVRHLEGRTGAPDGGLVYRNPYWLKEYVAYPRGASAVTIDIRETQSQVAPFSATARIEKQRFATAMYRRQDEAVADNRYLRDTGSETLTYEFRHGRWIRVGALFVAETIEEQVDGRWVPVPPEVRADLTPPRAPEGGFLSRTWSRLLGR